jgi:spermidine/putrescine transport system ATP-binding protein
MDGSPVALELQGLYRKFGSLVAVDHLDLTLYKGEFFTLLGASGCGKTTIMRLIAGFDQPDGGRVRLNGVDVTHLPPQRRNVHTMFQQYALFPHLNIWDNVAFGPRAQGQDRAEIRRRVGEMLEIIGLSEKAQFLPKDLSGGQRQRVALARALVNTPTLLLLDEPLGALDSSMRRGLQLELKRIQREVGITFLMVSHDQDEAFSMSDRLVVLNAGRIEQIGTPREIYERSSTSYVAGFVGQANLIPMPDGAIGMVRPERIRLSTTSPNSEEEGWQGHLSAVFYQGSEWRLELTRADGKTLSILVNAADVLNTPSLGDSYWAIWSRVDVHALADRVGAS